MSTVEPCKGGSIVCVKMEKNIQPWVYCATKETFTLIN